MGFLRRLFRRRRRHPDTIGNVLAFRYSRGQCRKTVIHARDLRSAIKGKIDEAVS